jgi:hypothetical protein
MEGPAIGLLEEADNADAVVAIFHPLRNFNGQDDFEITTVMDLLAVISDVLKDINLAMGSLRYARRVQLIDEDLELILPSIHLTLMPIRRMFNRHGLDRVGSRVSDFRHAWRDILDFFENERATSLTDRMALYKVFLQELFRRLTGFV